MYFFTADEHYGHEKVIEYHNRPFSSDKEMDAQLIKNHNSVVKSNNIVIHVGDFTLRGKTFANYIIEQLNGQHIFIQGSHDYWLKSGIQIFERKIDGQYIVACHYAMTVWPRSHYNSWLCFGHSHGKLDQFGKAWDVGVDNNNYFPVSFEQLKEIMEKRPDNFNLVKPRY